MTSINFAIPLEFVSQLRETEIKDRRSDEEILAALSQHVPVTTEKNIWAFWDKGIQKMPSWTQRNVCDWIRICGNGDKPWTIRVLDAIPDSPNYALNFIPKDMLPQAFVDGEMTGPYVGPHSADFLRGACLYLHGGVFLDVGCIMFRHLDRVAWNVLESPTTPYQIAVPVMYAQIIANHFIMSRKGNPFIKRWHDLFVHFWSGRTDHKGIMQDPLLAFTANLDFNESRASNFHWDFKVDPLTVFEYIAQVLSWLRLTMLEAPTGEDDGFSGAKYWQKHILCIDSLQECWGMEATIGFKGDDAYAALSTSRSADSESEEYKKAHGLVWRLLAQSSIQKITHGKHLTKDTHLGMHWDENEGKDVEPGSFAELLRWGSTHFEQVREGIVTMEATKAKETMRKGVLEA